MKQLSERAPHPDAEQQWRGGDERQREQQVRLKFAECGDQSEQAGRVVSWPGAAEPVDCSGQEFDCTQYI